MQREIDAEAHARPVHIIGINLAGLERYNATFCERRTLPWLQDVPAQNVWGSWNATWRDVVILDSKNRITRVYNLTEHDLGVSANYTELRSILLGAAER